jgi:hypothetical protein
MAFWGCRPKSLLPEDEMLVKMRNMKLVFLHGPPAVGKLTVARELAQLTGFRLFHNHLTVDLVTSLFPFGSEPFVNLRERIWLDAFAEASRQNVSLIFTFNPERTVREQFVADAVEAVQTNGGEIVFVELTCTETELEKRMAADSRKELWWTRRTLRQRKRQNSSLIMSPDVTRFAA